MTPLTPEDVRMLARLADAVIPPDTRDAGAGAVDTGPWLAERIASGLNASLYCEGLRIAHAAAREAAATHEASAPDAMLLDRVRVEAPAFFRQLRLDVCARYLSDPGVWQRIGFPGPSIETGGYPDFDRPQP